MYGIGVQEKEAAICHNPLSIDGHVSKEVNISRTLSVLVHGIATTKHVKIK
jgi:hypothetical protein